jgi:hypothetical protein
MSKKRLARATKRVRVQTVPKFKRNRMGEVTGIVYDIYGPSYLKRL